MAARQQLIQITRQWIQAHNKRDAAGVAALIAPGFIANSFPSTLGDPSRNAEEYVAFQALAFTIFDSYHVAETDLIVDEAQNKVVYYLIAEGTAPAGEYKNEYIHKLTFTKDGKFIQALDAFLDSQAMVAWMGKMQTAQGAEEATN